MVWQDYLIAACIIAFSYALIPQIYTGFKEKKGLITLQTSFITSVGMYILTLTYISLKLTFSAIMGEITAILWTILFAQKIKYN